MSAKEASFMSKVDRFFGVMPPNTIRRITIAVIVLFIAIIADAFALFGQSTGLVDKVPYLTPQLINLLLVTSLLFGISLFYYVIMPGKEKRIAAAYSVLE